MKIGKRKLKKLRKIVGYKDYVKELKKSRTLEMESKKKVKKEPKVVLKGRYYVVESSGERYHRYVYRKHYGKIPSGWHIHHIDCCPLNNCHTNLIALPGKLHMQIHKEMHRGNFYYSREELERILAANTDLLGRIEEKLKEVRAEIRALKRKEKKLKENFNDLRYKVDICPTVRRKPVEEDNACRCNHCGKLIPYQPDAELRTCLDCWE